MNTEQLTESLELLPPMIDIAKGDVAGEGLSPMKQTALASVLRQAALDIRLVAAGGTNGDEVPRPLRDMLDSSVPMLEHQAATLGQGRPVARDLEWLAAGLRLLIGELKKAPASSYASAPTPAMIVNRRYLRSTCRLFSPSGR